MVDLPVLSKWNQSKLQAKYTPNAAITLKTTTITKKFRHSS
ncbi:hypothetical protein N476_14170 [Pseudoalteromonas luteoviolacea H33]|uniref:Uncharacterized protein n=1 Tax=Pseudoalteromonas luteoviolacea H33 TaxID=1365251 RepID=A0A167EPC3_9GAMM|nr:hypothetical protein N476_14170 [Pseudoalteromonas luteoviolacea H33]KZN72171.1 hypothetical protein N477_03255 [Pseudoalteromonas luteoviolacea H33-S]